MISHRHTGCWEGSGSEDSQCKRPGVETAFASPRNRKDHKVEMQGCDGQDGGAGDYRQSRQVWMPTGGFCPQYSRKPWVGRGSTGGGCSPKKVAMAVLKKEAT